MAFNGQIFFLNRPFHVFFRDLNDPFSFFKSCVTVVGVSATADVGDAHVDVTWSCTDIAPYTTIIVPRGNQSLTYARERLCMIEILFSNRRFTNVRFTSGEWCASPALAVEIQNLFGASRGRRGT